MGPHSVVLTDQPTHCVFFAALGEHGSGLGPAPPRPTPLFGAFHTGAVLSAIDGLENSLQFLIRECRPCWHLRCCHQSHHPNPGLSTARLAWRLLTKRQRNVRCQVTLMEALCARLLGLLLRHERYALGQDLDFFPTSCHWSRPDKLLDKVMANIVMSRASCTRTRGPMTTVADYVACARVATGTCGAGKQVCSCPSVTKKASRS